MELAYTSVGSGPPVLLLHDLFASSDCWGVVAEGLAPSARVVSVDLRNHGRSPRSADMSYLSMADDVLRLIERLALDQPVLVGHGLGGKVAMVLALATPWALGALVVIDATPWTLVEPCAERTPVDPRCKLLAIALSRHALGGFPRHLRHLSTPLPLHAWVGSRSHLSCPADASAFRPMFPNARVEVIDGADPGTLFTRPDLLLAPVKRARDAAAPTHDLPFAA